MNEDLFYPVPVKDLATGNLIKLVHEKLEITSSFELIQTVRLEFYTDDEGTFGIPLSEAVRGKLITKEYTDSKFVSPEPMPIDSTEDQLKQEYYQEELAKGTPQFAFWWTVANQLSLNDALIESIKLLDEEGFFL